MQELRYLLLHELRRLGIDTHFTLVLKPYSKSYFGRYNPNTNTVTLYVYKTKECKEFYKTWDLLKTLIHEVCHYLQWKDPKFKRHKGIMHNNDFWKKYDFYVKRAIQLNINKEV